MLTTKERELLRGLVQLGVFAGLVWLSMPNRPSVGPYAWRMAARGAQALSDHSQILALWCRTHYWKAVRP